MINNVVLVGRLTKDPDLRYTSTGKAVATYTLAVNRNYTNQAGNREADFINCVVWGKRAESLAKYTRKGSLIGTTGRLQTRNYENQQGNRVYVTEVLAENFQLLESRNTTESRQATQEKNDATGNAQQSTHEMPPYTDNDFPSGSSIDISDDDLPF